MGHSDIFGYKTSSTFQFIEYRPPVKHHLTRLLHIAFTFVLLLFSHPSYASLEEYFTDETGHTNWQYVANWSSGILIILLSTSAIFLFFSRRQINLSNRALKVMNDELELRVQERTATLDQSNQKLKEANSLLESEIIEHKQTTQRLHASEAYIKNILESMPIMLVGLNKDGVVTQWNREAENITGLKAEDALHKVLWEAYPIMPVSQKRVNEAIQDNKTIHLRRSQRSHFHFEITIYPLDSLTETGVVILVDDVSQQVKSENKLIQKDKMSAMGELSSMMASDINLPLQAINEEVKQAKSICQLLDSNFSQDTFQKLTDSIGTIDKQNLRATAITRNLLDFSGSSPDALHPHAIPDIIDHSLELSNEIFSFIKGISFSDVQINRLYEEGVPPIPCFVSELQQVFVSLFRHSIYALRKAQRENFQPKITVQVLTSYDSLWIKVQHNGEGIDLDQQQVIFEPYFSDQQPIGNSDYDSSQRLSFPYFIITEHHQGHMAVTSDVDVGTTFHIALDLK